VPSFSLIDDKEKHRSEDRHGQDEVGHSSGSTTCTIATPLGTTGLCGRTIDRGPAQIGASGTTRVRLTTLLDAVGATRRNGGQVVNLVRTGGRQTGIAVQDKAI
jgi:hypothetical protein